MTDDTKPESASERDEKLATEYRETTYPGWHRSPDYHSCHKRDFIAGRQSMREELADLGIGQILIELRAREKTISELRAALERIDKWTIDPKDRAVDENFALPGARQFIKDVIRETLARTEVR